MLVLIFGSTFFVIISSFMGFIITQKQTQDDRRDSERALAIAEAGLNYYKWYLAHNPNDLQNGTGQPGPYTMDYSDPEDGTIGEFELTVTGNRACGDVMSVDISSVGSTTDSPDTTREVSGRYARPTVAEYAFIINSNVWAGPDRTIVGPYHSNGVVRMDGTNNSIVSSGQESWQCDGSLPCDPYNQGQTVPAVYGNGVNNDLWLYPRPPINFTGITVDLANIQDKAQNAGGLYLPRSNQYGYRVSFQSNGTVDVYVVDDVHSYQGYTTEEGWEEEQNVIDDDDWMGSYDIDEDCPVIFVEDKVWLEGVVNGKVTLVAADVDTPGRDPSIVLNANITYATADSGLLAIAEEDVLLGLTVPNDMSLNGIFVAQSGRFGRNHYDEAHLPHECAFWFLWWCIGGETMFEEYIKRNSLTVNGSIVSNGRVGTKWVNQYDQFSSGFNTRTNSYDRNLVSDPPPLAPTVSDTYQFIEWREVE